ncbi:MAG: hypothetical protein ACREOG_14385, partial [Gemmatimonadaceae bacterium]
LDTTFLAAASWLITGSASIDRCDVGDSVVRAIERRRTQFSQADLAMIRHRRARCNRDWEQSIVEMRDRVVAEPGSTLPRWALAANLRRANRPAEAVVVLHALDPTRDLGWMSDDGKVMYWREMAWAYHTLGDSAGQQLAVAGFRRMAPGRLATVYFTSLQRVSAGRPNEAVDALSEVERFTADPPMVAGEISGRLPPARVATPAWVLYQIGTELLSIGDSVRSVALARRAVRWLATRPSEERSTVAARYQRILALELEGALDSAWTDVRQLVQYAPANIEIRGRMGVLAARRGDRAAAMAVDGWLARLTGAMPPGLPHFERARIAAVLGEHDRAMELLETLPFGMHPVDVAFLHSDPAFRSLHSDERWIRMLKPRG